MNTPIIYSPDTFFFPELYFNNLRDRLQWVQYENVPRKEYYCNRFDEPYTYGKGNGVRTYHPQYFHGDIKCIQAIAEAYSGDTYDACFLNYYEDGSDHLGWHSDDSPEMDDKRSIAIVSLGQEREIWFRPRPELWEKISDTIPPIEKLTLGNGSLCIMKAGMQDTHQHRIPKAGFQPCGPRISLTFRGLVDF